MEDSMLEHYLQSEVMAAAAGTLVVISVQGPPSAGPHLAKLP